MSGSLLRSRFAAVAVRVETTPGTDAIAGSPLLADLILGDCQVRFGAQVVQDPSFSGSLDVLPPALGSFQPTLELRVPLRGSGAGGTAPSWGRLLQACSMEQVIDNTGVAATAATAGSATTLTLPVGFSNTAQIYRGVPLLLTGNPSGGAVAACLDYTSGRVATLAETYSPVLSTSTLVQVPPNVLWRPTSDETIYKTVTAYLWKDGYRWRFVGGTGTARLDLSTGGIGTLVFSLQAQMLDQGANANPTMLLAGAAQQPPIFQGGKARLLGLKAQLRSASFDLGVSTALPPDPEASGGVGPGVPISRASMLTLDPLIDTTNQAALFDAFRSGTSGSFYAQLGTTPGNRFMATMPSIRQLQQDPGESQGFEANSIRAQANLTDAGFLLCQY